MAARLWEIRETYGNRSRKKYSDPDLQEAYECGFDEGYEEAEGKMMGQRHPMGQRGYRMDMGERGGYMGRRDDMDDYDMGERRMRDSRGRYM